MEKLMDLSKTMPEVFFMVKNCVKVERLKHNKMTYKLWVNF